MDLWGSIVTIPTMLWNNWQGIAMIGLYSFLIDMVGSYIPGKNSNVILAYAWEGLKMAGVMLAWSGRSMPGPSPQNKEGY